LRPYVIDILIKINFRLWQDLKSIDIKNYHHDKFCIDIRGKMPTLDIQEIKRCIRRIAQRGSRGIALTNHCRDQMVAREVDINDILNVLNWGTVIHDPSESANMKFKVLGEDLEGVALCVVIIILDQDSLLGITVHG
jgi:hypothetical protein